MACASPCAPGSDGQSNSGRFGGTIATTSGSAGRLRIARSLLMCSAKLGATAMLTWSTSRMPVSGRRSSENGISPSIASGITTSRRIRSKSAGRCPSSSRPSAAAVGDGELHVVAVQVPDAVEMGNTQPLLLEPGALAFNELDSLQQLLARRSPSTAFVFSAGSGEMDGGFFEDESKPVVVLEDSV